MALMIEMYSLRVGPRQDATRENTYEKDQRVILWHTAPKLHKRNPAITFIRARSYNILFGYRFGNPKVGYVGCVKWKMKDDNLWDLRTKWKCFHIAKKKQFLNRISNIHMCTYTSILVAAFNNGYFSFGLGRRARQIYWQSLAIRVLLRITDTNTFSSFQTCHAFGVPHLFNQSH